MTHFVMLLSRLTSLTAREIRFMAMLELASNAAVEFDKLWI